MEIGVVLPTIGPGASRDGLRTGAQIADDLGWSSVWVTDHVLVPKGDEAEEYGTILEAMVSLSYVAGLHPSLRIGTSVIVPPLRNPVILAKQFATLDVLSEGKLIVGVGVADRSDIGEFRNLGVDHRMDGRGAFVDEAIEMWRHLWSGSPPPFSGKFFSLDDYVFSPLPPQGSSLPIWTGGRSAMAMRRAARFADGYHSARSGPQDMAQRRSELQVLCDEIGRPLPAISVRVRLRFDQPESSVYTMYGDSSDVAREVARFADAGVDHLVVVLEETEPDAIRSTAERFHEHCVQHVLA
jgi:probable F420-dependent oxidoreductase